MSMLLPAFKASTGLRDQDLRTIIINAPRRYKTYEIPKRSGGMRLVSQPAREVKALQRIIIRDILDALPVHPAATAYRKGLSIKENASRHVLNGPILKLDFKNFFPSLTALDWERFCRKNEIFSDPEDLIISTNILFCRYKNAPGLRLAIGAPSSPMLSNILLHSFDSLLAKNLEGRNICYTRYADDLVFSAPRTGYLHGVEKLVKSTLKQIGNPRLQLNPEKRVLATKKYKRMVTGLILSNDEKVSIGYQRKQWLRVAMHQASHDRLNEKELAILSGWLAFANDVEPDLYKKICSKHEPSLLHRIKSAPRR